jgi:hypothetical protein
MIIFFRDIYPNILPLPTTGFLVLIILACFWELSNFFMNITIAHISMLIYIFNLYSHDSRSNIYRQVVDCVTEVLFVVDTAVLFAIYDFCSWPPSYFCYVILYSNGAKTEPWGTHASIVFHSENCPSILTLNLRSA